MYLSPSSVEGRRLSRKAALATSMMLTGFLCLSFFAISFSCCAVLVNPVYHEDEARYQRDLDDFDVYKSQHYRRTLDQDFHGSRGGSVELVGGPEEGDDVTDEDVDEEYAPHDDTEYNKDIINNNHVSGHHHKNNLHVESGRTKPGGTSRDHGLTYNSNSNYNNIDSDNYNEVRSSSKNTMAIAKSNGTKKLPVAIIIGVKKGGTRALLEFIRIHPDVRAPGPEPHFFDRHYDKGLEWYRQQMPTTIEGQITMEKTPGYFVTKNVPARIYNMSHQMKMILVVRDPVTRALSDYAQTASKREVKPFEEMAFLDNSTGLVDTSWGAIRIGVYAKHLERWLKYFPLSQIHIVDGAKLISNPAGEMIKVQSFLGLKQVITEKHFFFNSTKGFPCLKKPEKGDKPHCLGKTKGRPHPKVEPQLLQRLHDFYRPFNQKFYQMTGRDFGWT